MLAHREQKSSRFYPEIPSVIAKSLIAKYQRNKRCQAATNLVLPLVGDQGRQIKHQGESFQPTGTIGVDRNSVGNVAVLADPQNGLLDCGERSVLIFGCPNQSSL
jgi:hypothetical protein